MAELSVNRIAVIRYKDKSVACKDAISFGEMILDFDTKIMYKVVQKIPANTPLETAIDNESVEVVSAFDENGTYPKMSVGFAYDITPNEGDAITDNTPFIWQTSGGEASIAPSSTGIIKKILGTTILSYIEDGKRVPFTGTHIVSRGTNLFNYQDETKRIVGRKLNSDGSITADSSYTLFFVNVLAGVNGGNNGYIPVVKDGETLSGIGFEYLGFQIQQPTEETASITLLTRSTHGNASSYLPSDNGWIVFSLLTEKQDCLSMQFVWSYSESQFEFVEYEESVLDLPSVCETGLYGIGSVCDEINNNNGGQYIKRIGVVNTSTLTWERWTESVYDIETQQYIDVFQGYKTSSLASTIAKSTENITHDYLYQLTNAHTDAEGVLYFTADGEDADILAQLTNGVNLMYELAIYETSSVAFSGLINVWDFGDTRIFGATIWNESVYGIVSYINPYALTFLYSVNLRDVLRSVANSGVTFNGNGIVTSGLFFGQPIETKTLNGTSQWDIDDLRTMMRVLLSGSTNTIILPNGGENPFRFQIIVVQDSTGSRSLTISGASGVNVFNPSEFDFSSGGANQLCVCTIIWDCNEYIFECTNYVGGN